MRDKCKRMTKGGSHPKVGMCAQRASRVALEQKKRGKQECDWDENGTKIGNEGENKNSSRSRRTYLSELEPAVAGWGGPAGFGSPLPEEGLPL